MKTDNNTDVNNGQVEHILECIEMGKKEGAVVACGGKRAMEGKFAGGCFMKPTLLVNVTNDMHIAQGYQSCSTSCKRRGDRQDVGQYI